MDKKTAHPEVPWDELDPGIAKAVRALRESGQNTTSSCQGGHCYPKEMAWVLIEPRPGEDTEMLKIISGQALFDAGFHGYTISIRRDYWYQKSPDPWKTQPHKNKPYLFIEFWTKQGI